MTRPFYRHAGIALAALTLAGCTSGARSRQDEATIANCRAQSQAIQNRQNRGAGYHDATVGTPFAGGQLPSNPSNQMSELHSYLSDVDSCVRGSTANLRDNSAGNNEDTDSADLQPATPTAAPAPASHK